MKTGALNFFQFDEDNEIKFYQDFGFYQHVDPKVKWFCESVTDRDVILVGDGNGVLDRHRDKGINGSYGNGSIHISKTELPEDVLTFCINNKL